MSTLQSSDLTVPSTEPQSCLSLPDILEVDWTSSELALLQDFELDPSFTNMNFDGFTLPQNTYSPYDTNQGHYGLKPQSPLRFSSPPVRLYEPEPPSSQLNLISSRFSSKSQTPRFEWGNHINTEHPRSKIHLIRQLGDLSVCLYEHLAKIPPTSIHDQPNNELQDTGFSIDNTFKLTQDLIDIYPAFLDTFIRGGAISGESNAEPSQANTPLDFTMPDNIVCAESPNHLEKSVHSSISYDNSSILLLLSCHVRVIEIYDELFKHMRICMDRSVDCPSHRRQAKLKTPPVKIGTFTPPPSSAIPMQMMLLIQFASQLSDNSSELAAHLQVPQSLEKFRGFDKDIDRDGVTNEALMLSWSTAEKVKCRAELMSQQLSAARSEILGNGFLA